MSDVLQATISLLNYFQSLLCGCPCSSSGFLHPSPTGSRTIDQQEVSQASFSSNPPVCGEKVKESYILHGGRPFLLRVWPISIRDISCKLARNTALLEIGRAHV